MLPKIMSAIGDKVAAPPALYGPEHHNFEGFARIAQNTSAAQLSRHELDSYYEIGRTAREIEQGGWKRVGLQFEDSMLTHAVQIYTRLKQILAGVPGQSSAQIELHDGEAKLNASQPEQHQLFILGDTSYGACCADEIAAEHVAAQVIVHYGRTCLSPTSRLPVIYVFTSRPIDLESAMAKFRAVYPSLDSSVLLVSDAPYYHRQELLFDEIKKAGYSRVFATKLIHDTSSLIPNRTLPVELMQNQKALKEYKIFHIGQPPVALLLTLFSRVSEFEIYSGDDTEPKTSFVSVNLALKKRYALITSLSAASVFGILINTLSVKNYLHIVQRVQRHIERANKKYYTFVVGKVNAAKIANFSEVSGWVVIGCWESSLIESSEFYRPLITPFELDLVLQSDHERVWTGEWTSDFEQVLQQPERDEIPRLDPRSDNGSTEDTEIDTSSDDESAPPEFDLRTGRYVSRSEQKEASHRTRRAEVVQDGIKDVPCQPGKTTKTLVVRGKTGIAVIGGIQSPGAEYLNSQRTWQGLGSEFGQEAGQGSEAGALVEEGRSGVARGYMAEKQADGS